MSSLFNNEHIDRHTDRLRLRLLDEVNRIPDAQIVGMDAKTTAKAMASKYSIDLPVLIPSGITVDEPIFDSSPRAVESSDLYLTAHIPFTGDKEMFQCYGSSRPMIYDSVGVYGNEITVTLRTTRYELPRFQEQVDLFVSRVRDGLSPMKAHAEHLQPMLINSAVTRIQERQGMLARHTALLTQMNSIGFPLRRRDDGSEKVIIPVKARQIETRPLPTPAKPTPEPELAVADYDAVLQVIRDMVRVVEHSPSAFKAMEEEDLRTILLVGLNGIFKGNATAETFNGAGKTDILIRADNNNIFIAECLIWKGQEHFRRKLTEQLFNYSTWRDSKLAAIIFNRNRDFTAVVQKMRETASGLENCIGSEPYQCESGARYRLRRTDDAQKQFLLTCLAFEVPS